MLHELETKIIDSYLNKELANMEKDIALWMAKVLIRLDFQAKMSFDELYDGIINQVKAYRTTDSLEGVSNEGIEELIKGLLHEMENVNEK
jgi:hypothetical protein